jgi:hypothetical protein
MSGSGLVNPEQINDKPEVSYFPKLRLNGPNQANSSGVKNGTNLETINLSHQAANRQSEHILAKVELSPKYHKPNSYESPLAKSINEKRYTQL